MPLISVEDCCLWQQSKSWLQIELFHILPLYLHIGMSPQVEYKKKLPLTVKILLDYPQRHLIRRPINLNEFVWKYKNVTWSFLNASLR